jgi:DNA polymerase III epsilon subunit-like protein
MIRLLVGDVETTDPTPDAGVVELAWIEIDRDLQILDKRHSLIDPERKISASASGVHGITYEDVADKPTFDEFFDVVLGAGHFAPDDEIILIAHKADFDRQFFGRRIKIVDTICTLRLARKVWPKAENHKLQTLMYELGLCRTRSHSADGDVETCLDLLRLIMEKTGATMEELPAFAAAPIWVEKMTFGKHKDLPVEKLDRSYIAWLFKNVTTLDPDLKRTLEKVLAEKK